MFWHSGDIVVFLISFFVTLFAAPSAIATLRTLKVGQVIQSEGPESHASKSGTPAMGGLIILIGILAGAAWILHRKAILSGPGREVTIFAAVLLLILVYAAIGLADDWLTIRPKGGVRGIGSKPKFLLQLIAATGFVWWLSHTGQLDTVVNFGSWLNFDLGWAYAPLAVLFITGMANFVNITDGLDGLAPGLLVIMAVTLAGLPSLSLIGVVDPSFNWLLLSIAGACMAFLWFNFNPAKVFMGDTGSLAMGVAIPALAIVMKLELPAIIAGMVFILDGLSSAVQWAVFKYTRVRTGTGRRVFKMSPIHHHFELSGWPEQLVVIRFWIVGLLFAILALLLSMGGQI